MIKDIETAIVDRLKTLYGNNAAVEAFPDDPKVYRMIHPKAAVLVTYRGMDLSIPDSRDVVVQDAELQWTVTTIARNLRVHSGAYAFLDANRASLLGWRYTAAHGMFLRDEKFLSQIDGLWTYGQVFAHGLPILQVEDVSEILGPLLKKLTLDDPAYGDVVVESQV